MAIEITYEQVKQTLLDIAAENENYICPKRPGMMSDTPSCRYVWERQPDCIIGRLLHRLGVDLVLMRGMEGASAHGVLSGLFSTGVLQSEEDEEITDLCYYTQSWQDYGMTWNEAVQKGIAGDRDL